MIRKGFKYLIDTIIFSNVLIALAAGALYAATCFLVNQPIDGSILFVILGTLFFYTFLRFRTLDEKNNNNGPLTEWMRKHQLIAVISMSLSVLTMGLLAYSLNLYTFELVILFGFAGLLGLLYTGIGQINIRDISVLKTPVVAVVWVLVTTAFPILYYNLVLIDFAPLIIIHFCFILGLTIPFEIRDLKYDTVNKGLKTIPMLIGMKSTKHLAVLFLLIALLLGLWFYQLWLFIPIVVALIRIIYRLDGSSSEYWFTGVLDGFIL